MTSWRIIEGDCRERMAAMPEASVDAIVTDPPYDLTANKRGGSGVASVNLDTPHGRARIGTGNGAGGFMGKAWDGTGVAFDPATWREVARVLRPGGYLLAFGGTRTYHRMVCAIEDAGFEIRDTIAWLYGSGFPKHPSCLKPAHEPIVLARKAGPRSEPLQIDAARIAGEVPATIQGQSAAQQVGAMYSGRDQRERREFVPADGGRWPANVVLDPEAAALLDGQTGECRSAGIYERGPVSETGVTFGNLGRDEMTTAMYADSGGASRFFYVAKPDTAERNVGLTDRNPHPTVKPVALMRWLCRLITPPGGTVLDPFTGSGTTGIAALREGFAFVGIEQDAEYVQIARARIIGDAPLLNSAAEAA